MTLQNRSSNAPAWLILMAGCVFVFILALSAFFEADIRWLHFFQAWMYIVTIVLAFLKNRWGLFVGISAAGLWDYANIFATTFFFTGMHELSQWIRTGHVARPDQLIAVPAWFANLFVVVGCVWAYSRLPEKKLGDTGRFIVAFILTTGFFALDMALFQPRYLNIFGRLLHPRWP